MKNPAEYLNCPVFELTYPTGESAESVPVVAYNDAVRAVELALADAEKYKYLLMRALRRHATDTQISYPAMPTLVSAEEVPETTIYPLYPDMAA